MMIVYLRLQDDTVNTKGGGNSPVVRLRTEKRRSRLRSDRGKWLPADLEIIEMIRQDISNLEIREETL